MFDVSSLFADAPRTVRLRNGSNCRIRPLTEADGHLLLDCFERMSPDSRRMRFLAAKRALSEEDLSFLCSVDGYDHLAVIATGLNALGEETDALGFASCNRLAQTPESAEMSIAVADDVQRLGVGSALLDRLQVLARSVGIRRFVCEALAENRGMGALASRKGSDTRWHGGGTLEYDWPVPDDWPSDPLLWSSDPYRELGKSVDLWWTLMGQSVRIGMGYYGAIFRRFSDFEAVKRSFYPG